MIYAPTIAEGYEWINACDGKDYEVFASFNGTPLRDSWRPIKVRRVHADDRSPAYSSDFPWLGSDALVMRQKAVDALRDILETNGEILPLATDDGIPLFVHNTQVVDALDEANSDIVRFQNSDRIMRIQKEVFIPVLIKDLDMFRVPLRASQTYVSEKFRQRYEKSGLVGLRFRNAGVYRTLRDELFGKY